MALNVARANYDAATHDNGSGGLLQLPWFSDQYHAHYVNRGFAVPPELQSVDWRVAVKGRLAVADMKFANVVNQSTGALNYTISPRTGVEFDVRTQLANIGFKPDAQSFRLGRTIEKLTFSRVQDLEGFLAFRGHPFTINDVRVTSHVVPYVFATFTVPSTGAYNIYTLLGVLAPNGLFLPSPWPRTLNAMSFWRADNTAPFGWRKHWPRGARIPATTASGPRYVPIHDDGTMYFNSSWDAGLSPVNNTVIFNAGFTYELWIGHAELLPGTFYHQRYPRGFTWKPGDPVTY